MQPDILKLRKRADQNDAEAQYLLATEYVFADVLEHDVRSALYWYLRSANGGYVAAQWNAGIMLIEGEDGIVKNFDVGQELVEKAAAAGHPNAIEYLAVCYEKGIHGFRKDNAHKIKWKKALEGRAPMKVFAEPAQISPEQLGLRKPA